jgi:hypothetical protein
MTEPPPTPRPIVVMREYRQQRQYERDLVRLRRDGWRVVSVLERPARPRWQDHVTGGLYSALFPPDPERLVTYQWEGRDPLPAQPVQWRPTDGAAGVDRSLSGRWWWILAVVLLVALLLIGVVSLFADVVDIPALALAAP